MSTLILNPRCSVYIRMNFDILYADFDTKTLSLYDISTDDYHELPLSFVDDGAYVYYVQANSISSTVSINYLTRELVIVPDNELTYFEQVQAQQYAI